MMNFTMHEDFPKYASSPGLFVLFPEDLYQRNIEAGSTVATNKWSIYQPELPVELCSLMKAFDKKLDIKPTIFITI